MNFPEYVNPFPARDLFILSVARARTVSFSLIHCSLDLEFQAYISHGAVKGLTVQADTPRPPSLFISLIGQGWSFTPD